MLWEFRHSVVVAVAREAAWAFWSDVRNWTLDPAIEWVRIDGPFAAGSTGTTKSHGQEPTLWRLTEVAPSERAAIEIHTPGATARFTWDFEALPGGRARLTQHVEIEGPDVDRFAPEAREGFAQGFREGMARLGSRIEEATGPP